MSNQGIGKWVDRRYRLMLAVKSHSESVINGTPDTVDFRDALFFTMHQAEVVAWDYDIFSASTNGSEAYIDKVPPSTFFLAKSQLWFPDFTREEQVPAFEDYDGKWWSPLATLFLRTTLPRINEYSSGELNDLRPEHFDHAGKRLVVVTLVFRPSEGWKDAKEKNAPLFMFSGSEWIVEREPLQKQFCDWIAAWQFMNGTIAKAEKMTGNHAERKAYERQNVPIPEIKTVVLRRAYGEKVLQSECKRGDWSCQWLVGGHWRRLHEPRKSDGAEVIYIDSYIKGPEDMPFRAPRETVFVAKR